MKKISFLFLLFTMNITGNGQTIANMPPGTYNDMDFSGSVSTIENLSNNFRGLNKIAGIFPDHVTYSTITWPSGAWGRGYQTWPGWTDSIFWSNGGVFQGCHPLTRDVSAFLRGHLYLYLSGRTTQNEQTIKDGIDYLLSEQVHSGTISSIGGFKFWYKRASQTNPNDDASNTTHPYETAYALVALSEYYNSNINYRDADVLFAINLATTNLANINWSGPGNNNSNIRALGLWGLCASYKATKNCNTLSEIKELTTWLIEQQNHDPAHIEKNGVWFFGGDEDGGTSCPMDHDTRIPYHFFMIRGLVEAFSIIPDQDEGYKWDVVNSLKMAINHVINYRFVSNSTTNPYLKRYYIDQCTNPAPNTPSSYLDEVECWIDALSKLRYYARSSTFFTLQERVNIKKLHNKLASGLALGADEDRKWHLCAIGSYMAYNKAITQNTTILDWGGPNLNYNAPNITDRVVLGDFDNDGFEDDIAAFYDYGGGHTMLHVWKSNGASFEYLWKWDVTGYDASKITSRVISGDFDNDGVKDDIAAFYDYGGSNTKIHIWKLNNTGITYLWSWETNGYDVNKITGRLVSGDFDNDGYFDDIAAFYDYANGTTKMHLWKSGGGAGAITFAYSWVWQPAPGAYDANKITNRVVSGDFDNDGKHDDIAAFYDHGNQTTKMHIWKSNGGGAGTTTFAYSWIWEPAATTYDANKITDRVVSGDFDNDGKYDDIVAFYDYGSGGTKMHFWKSNITSFAYTWEWDVTGYSANKITGRVVSGDFAQNCRTRSIAAFYDYGIDNTRTHIWLDKIYQGPSSWWLPCTKQFASNCIYARENKFISKNENTLVNGEELNQDNYQTISVMPNPFANTLELLNNSNKEVTIRIYDLSGQLILTEKTMDSRIIINTESISPGIYLVKTELNKQLRTFKVIKY